jgi:hypothetical protein
MYLPVGADLDPKVEKIIDEMKRTQTVFAWIAGTLITAAAGAIVYMAYDDRRLSRRR